MRRLITVILLVLCLAVSGEVWAASSCTASHEQYGSIHALTFEWTAHTDGSFTNYTAQYAVNGFILYLETDPGTPAPQASYDIELLDTAGADMAGGVLANRSATDTEIKRPLLDSAAYEVPVIGPLTLKISGNNVNGAKGTVKVFYKTCP